MRHLIVAALVLVSVACGDSPTRPSVPACERNNTARLSLENRSRTGRTFDVFVDAGRVATISSGSRSAPQTVVAGVAHYVSFVVTNTTFEACYTVPIPVRCSDTTYYCDF